MSPSKRQRPTAGKGKSQRPSAPKSNPVQRRRLGLLIFGVGFVVLFLGFAIAEGIGDPDIPSGDVAVVESAPGDLGDVTKAEFDHALEQTAAQKGTKEIPKPGDPQFDELKEEAENALFESIWLQGEAAEMGIEVSDREIAQELKKVKKQSFKSEAEFKKFLKKSHFTSADVNERVKLQILSGKVQEELKESSGDPSHSEVEDYYEAVKSTQFVKPASRDVRQIVNKDVKKLEAAKAALEKDDSPKSWEEVAKKYSEDAATKSTGGLVSAVTAESGRFAKNVEAAVFAAPVNRIEGPLKGDGNSVVFEVKVVSPESVEELKAVEAQIQATLAEQAQSSTFESFLDDFSAKWKNRTFCASDYETERCANFKADAHLATADPACYEANPKKAPEACPAPVFQLVPAAPGSVTVLEPKGKQLPQRPRPVKEKGKAGATTELPEGFVPPAE